jgi:hypothetical protein
VSASAATFRAGLKAVPAILWGGLSAGVLDLSAAFLHWGKPIRITQGIASGLIGPQAAFQGGWGTVALGTALHFLIALSAAAVFYAASRKLTFLTRRAVLWGFLYGIAVYMFMSWIVLPLSAFPKSNAPFSMSGLVISLLTHMFCVGLPIALAVAKADVGLRLPDLSRKISPRI